MDKELLGLHQRMVSELQSEISRKEAEIDKLQDVLQYHADRVKELRGATMVHSSGERNEHGMPFMPDARLASTKKHEAAEIVLRDFHHPMRTAEIASALKGMGFGTDLDETTMHNGLFTAMSRKPEIFSKPDRGVWALAEWENGELNND